MLPTVRLSSVCRPTSAVIDQRRMTRRPSRPCGDGLPVKVGPSTRRFNSGFLAGDVDCNDLRVHLWSVGCIHDRRTVSHATLMRALSTHAVQGHVSLRGSSFSIHEHHATMAVLQPVNLYRLFLAFPVENENGVECGVSAASTVQLE